MKTFQIWNKLDTSGMDAELRARFLKKDGSEPEFLIVSGLESLEIAREVMEQERVRGYYYWIAQVAA